MQKIIIYLHNDDIEAAAWTVVSVSGSIQKAMQIGNLPELKTLAADADNEVIVIAPPQDVLLAETKLPKLNRHRLLQALPYALEEQLLHDVNELHFAIGEYQAEDILPVAIVTKQKMQTWLTALRNIEIYPSVILPAPLSIPVLENCWDIFIINDIAIARMGLHTGFSCDKHNLKELIELSLADNNKKPQAIYLENYTSEAFSLTVASANIIEKNLAEKHYLEDIALKLNHPGINLLQSPYQAKHKPAQNKKIWLLASYLLAAWIGLIFITNLVSYGILHYQSAKLEKNIASIYKHNFPNASAIVAPKERMTEKLNILLNNGNKNHLLAWLANLGKSLPEVSGLQIKLLDYRNNQLNLEFTANSSDKVDKLAKLLTEQGMSVKQQNVTANGSEVKGTLLITENKS